MLRNIALKIKRSKISKPLLKLGIRKNAFARKLYGSLIKVSLEKPIKVGDFLT